MSNVQGPKSTAEDFASARSIGHGALDVGPTVLPTAEEFAPLSAFERFAFRLTHRMNLGSWKRFWTWCQSVFGAGWIHISTYNLMRVYGLENVEAVDHDRPVMLVANHRSFFYMYVVSTTLFRRTRLRKKPFFSVPRRLYFLNPLGLF